MSNLYQLGADWKRLEHRLETLQEEATEPLNGKLTDELTAALGDIKEDFEDKVRNCTRFVLNLESDAAQIDAEIKRLQRMKSIKVNTAERLREWVRWNLETLGMKKFDAGIAKLSVLEGRESLKVDDAKAVSWPQDVFDACCEQSIKVNKKTLKEQFAARLRELPGVEVVKGEASLAIR